ncbi:hypothetical protein [Rufibacter psychrotolerans]|uniref:hypothetical protein n=1 Tax=Rufibacter psychrotolerans TaxID=2812556 RepID=UPI00196831A0|nr:hypothetical protein [Rufibacter sp. SYSU D00308]
MKAKATFLSYISAEKRLRKEQSKLKNAAKNAANNVEQAIQLDKRGSLVSSN